MMIRRRPKDSWKHSRWTYRRRALTHYAQAAVTAIPVAVGVVTLSLLLSVFLLVAGEVLIFVLLPRMPGFRRQVDESLERAACMRAAMSRSALLGRMDCQHQRELEQLEELTGRVQGASALDRCSSAEWLGLDSLLAVFVRIAIAHRESTAAFHSTGDVELAIKVAEVEASLDKTSGERRAWAERRLAILHDRRETWRRAREEQSILAAELSTIGELVRWMYEQSALGHCLDAHAEVAEAITACAKNGPMVRELAALERTEPVDPDILRMGRRAALEIVGAPQPSSTGNMPMMTMMPPMSPMSPMAPPIAMQQRIATMPAPNNGEVQSRADDMASLAARSMATRCA